MANIELLWWWVLFLLPLPFLLHRFLAPIKKRAAIRLPYLPQQIEHQAAPNTGAKILTILIWVLVLLAAARPVWYGEPINIQLEHRDLMLVVDLSGSMSQRDMKINHNNTYIDRLTVVKQVLSDFIQKREGDRLGLVLFADHAYLQTPLTLDRNTITQQLQQSVLGLIGQRTAIGEGIGLATKTFIDSDAPQRVMILLSDGSNTSGVLDPIEAATIAQKYNTTIYTVGVGAGEIVVQDLMFSRTVNTARDLDEVTLKKIAEITNGRYFRARNSQDLADIYDAIDQLEPVNLATQTWRSQTEWFTYPLGIALLLSLMLVVIRRNYV